MLIRDSSALSSFRCHTDRRLLILSRFILTIPGSQLDFDRCLFSGQVFRWQKLADNCWHGMDGSTFYRIERNGEEVEVETAGTEAVFRSLFRLDWDLAEVEREIVRADRRLAEHIDLLKGLRILRSESPTEVLFSFLCSSNNHIARIRQMIYFLAPPGQPFPKPESVAELTEDQLRQAGFGYRGATIPLAARQIVANGGSAWLDSLKTAPYQTARQELMALPGLGPKLAECICLFGLNHTDAFPIDTHVWQACTRLYFPELAGQNLTEKRYRMIGDAMRERFGKYAGWAQQLLFYENHLHWRSRR